MRLGLAGAVHGAALRRDGSRVQRVGRADCLRAAKRAEQGLADRVEFVEDDYRHVRGQYDAFVSVGMLEHVGPADYPTLGGVIDRSLTRRGRGLLHFIGRNQPGAAQPVDPQADFSRGVPADAARKCSSTCSSRRTCRCSTSRTCGCTTRRRSSTGGSRFEDAAGEVAAMFDDDVRPGVAALSRRLAGGVHDRLDAAVPGRVRARRQQRVPWTRVSG